MKRSEMHALVMTLIPFACGFALMRLTLFSMILSICIVCISCLISERGKMTASLSLSVLHVIVLFVVGYREVALYGAAAAATFSCVKCAGKRYDGMEMDRNLYIAAGIFYLLTAIYLGDYEGLSYVVTVYVPVLYRFIIPSVVHKCLVISKTTY